MLRQHWLKLGLALIVPLLLYAVLAERASWRPRTFHYADTTVAVAYSPDGHWLARLGQSQLELRNAYTERVIWSEALGDDAGRAVAFSPDNNTLAVGRNNSLQLWDVTTHRLQHDLLAHYPYWYNTKTLLFIPHSTHLITGGDQSPVLLWDAQSGKLLRVLERKLNFTPLALHDKTVALRLNWIAVYPVYHIRLRQLDTGQEQNVAYPTGYLHCAAFMPDGKTLAVGNGDGNILLWNISKGRWTRQFPAHSTVVTRLAISPNGQLLVSGGDDDIVKLWAAPQGKLLRTLTQHKGSINGLSFAPDGATLAVACGDAVQLWHVK